VNRPPATNRSGTLLLELVISGLVLGIILSTAIPMLGWVARERKLNQQQEAAILEAANLMERIAGLSWDELSSERVEELPISPALLRQLPDARSSAAVELDPGEPRLKRVRIEITWEVAPGRAAPPVKLASWFGDRSARGERDRQVGRRELKIAN